MRLIISKAILSLNKPILFWKWVFHINLAQTAILKFKPGVSDHFSQLWLFGQPVDFFRVPVWLFTKIAPIVPLDSKRLIVRSFHAIWVSFDQKTQFYNIRVWNEPFAFITCEVNMYMNSKHGNELRILGITVLIHHAQNKHIAYKT